MENQKMPDKTLVEEIVDDLITRLDTLENREVQIPDYGLQFKSLENLIKNAFPNHHTSIEEYKTFLEQQRIVSEQMKSQIMEVKGIISGLPKSIPIKHSLGIKAKGITIALTFVFLILAFLSGYCIHLWNENERMEANDIKYRAIRQTSPESTHWADTTYLRNPNAMIKNTVKLENEALEEAEAQLLARQKADEAKAAKQRLKDLKKKK